ncbi:DNA cytosine methyltransferase [soil metagenome]
MSIRKFSFYEFFAGGGMARLGLGARWRCDFANDFSAKKATAYRENFAPASEFVHADIATIEAKDLSGQADLAWASFPCQDLSVAGARAGLRGKRSGSFWEFSRIIGELKSESRAPRMILLENVIGALTSNGGADLAAVFGALATHGYRFGPMIIDAANFLPQSRVRLFILAVADDCAIPPPLLAEEERSGPLRKLRDALPRALQRNWIWWSLPSVPRSTLRLSDVVERSGKALDWQPRAMTQRIVSMMSPANRRKLDAAMACGEPAVGAVYRRTRKDPDTGVSVQRAEVRFDGMSGCLRTPAGGSSRQLLLFVENGEVRSRLLTGREAARLMGLPENYRLPKNYNDAYHLAGDGVAVPVVAWLDRSFLRPILTANEADQSKSVTQRRRRGAPV